MTTVSLPQLAGADVLTHSRIATKQACPRKHYYAYELGIRPADPAQHFRVGGAIHQGLDAIARGADLLAAIWIATAIYSEIPAWANTPELTEDWVVEREIVARLLSGYHWYWSGAGETPITPVEVVASEIAFDVEIKPSLPGRRPMRTMTFSGKIDKIVKLMGLADCIQPLAIMEHKTTGESIEPGSDYWLVAELDPQTLRYAYAARKLGHAVETVVRDVVRKPSIRPRKITKAEAAQIATDGTYCGETVPEVHRSVKAGDVEPAVLYGARLTQDIAERPTFYFARREIPLRRADIDDVMNQVWAEAHAIREARARGIWPQNRSACLEYGRCPYLSHCGRITPDAIPNGCVRLENVHPELEASAQ